MVGAGVESEAVEEGADDREGMVGDGTGFDEFGYCIPP